MDFIINPMEILNNFLHFLINFHVLFIAFLWFFYSVFYERIMYTNLYTIYIVFAILIFLGKPIIFYIGDFIDNEYLEAFHILTYFLVYNLIVYSALKLAIEWRETLKDIWILIKLISKISLKILAFNPIPIQQNQYNQKQQQKQQVSKKKILNTIGVYTSTNQKIDLFTNNTKRGGEALIYEASDGSIAKIFHNNNIDLKYKETVIQKLKNMNFSNSIVTPTEMLYNNKQAFIGYTMPKREGVELGKLLLKKITHYFPDYTLIDTIDLAISIIEAFEEIKKQSVVAGDINPRNILVQDKNNIFIIDTDSFQLGKPSPAYMEEYRRARHRNKDILSYLRTYKDDCFAVTTVVFQLLHFGLLPYGGSDEISLQEAQYIFNPYYPQKNLISNKVLIKAHNRLSHELKLAFRDVFKYDKSILISTLKKHLQAYKQELLEVQKERSKK